MDSKYVRNNVEFFTTTKLRNSASCGLLLQEYITMHGPLNVRLTFKRRIKSHLPFAGIIRSSPYSPRFQG